MRNENGLGLRVQGSEKTGQGKGSGVQESGNKGQKYRNPVSCTLFVVLFFFTLSLAPCLRTFAAETTDQANEDSPGMQAAYDEISAIKMKKYDELTAGIAELRGRIKELLEKENTLLSEKEKAKAALEAASREAEVADADVKKILGAASEENEKMRIFAEGAAKESSARREKIEKLKKDLEEVNAKLKELQDSKRKTETDNEARDKVYRKASAQQQALKGKKAAEGEEGEAERLQKEMEELEAKAQDGERLRQQLSEKVLASAEKSRAVEEQISALENEDALRAKELKEKIKNFDQTKNADGEKKRSAEKAKKIAGKAGAKVLVARTALQKIEADLEQVSGEKRQAEKDLEERTEELKVRISALVSQNDRDQTLLPKSPEAGEKNIRKRLKRAEKDLVSLQRKAEKAALVNEKFKAKFDKEILEKHFNLAVIYEMNGLYKDSEREYLECLKIDPKDADVHYNLAILYDDRLNNNKKAQKHYYSFLKNRPIGESGERVRDWIMRSELEKRLGVGVR